MKPHRPALPFPETRKFCFRDRLWYYPFHTQPRSQTWDFGPSGQLAGPMRGEKYDGHELQHQTARHRSWSSVCDLK